MLTFNRTDRGFTIGRFIDRYDMACSVQDSSLATEAAIWLGLDDARPVVMASKAASVGVNTTETTGWVPYPVPDEVLLHTRMHLTQAQVSALLPALQHFATHGRLPSPEDATGATEGARPPASASELRAYGDGIADALAARDALAESGPIPESFIETCIDAYAKLRYSEATGYFTAAEHFAADPEGYVKPATGARGTHG